MPYGDHIGFWIKGTPKNEGDKSDGSSTSTSASSSHRGSETSTPSGSPQPSSKRNDHTSRFYVMKCTQQKTLDTSVSNGTWYSKDLFFISSVLSWISLRKVKFIKDILQIHFCHYMYIK
jgi:hypothetical protein